MILCFTNGAPLQTIERYIKIHGQCVCQDTENGKDVQFVVVERTLTYAEYQESRAQLWEVNSSFLNTIRFSTAFDFMLKHFGITTH